MRLALLAKTWNLIKNVISSSFGSEVENGVEALRALLDEDLPSPVVVPFPAQPIHL